MSFTSMDCAHYAALTMFYGWNANLGKLPDETIRYRLVRRLAYVSGIVRMKNDLCDIVWGKIGATLLKVMKQVTKVSMHGYGENPFKNPPSAINNEEKRRLNRLEDVRTIPPFPRYDESNNAFVFTVVPGQIQDAFNDNLYAGKPRNFYGDPWIGGGASAFWHCSSNRNHDSTTVEEEMDAALLGYTIDDDDDRVWEFSSSTTTVLPKRNKQTIGESQRMRVFY